jgi:signal transduction histidine kinase
MPQIFDPFFTTKDVGAGTGLGLATARRIVVERHDGSLLLDSQPGRTTFRVRLPFSQTGK